MNKDNFKKLSGQFYTITNPFKNNYFLNGLKTLLKLL